MERALAAAPEDRGLRITMLSARRMAERAEEDPSVQIEHPEAVEKTHVPVSHHRVGPYWFVSAIPRGALVTEAPWEWWVSYAGDWVSRESYASLEDAMEAGVAFARSHKSKTMADQRRK